MTCPTLIRKDSASHHVETMKYLLNLMLLVEWPLCYFFTSHIFFCFQADAAATITVSWGLVWQAIRWSACSWLTRFPSSISTLTLTGLWESRRLPFVNMADTEWASALATEEAKLRKVRRSRLKLERFSANWKPLKITSMRSSMNCAVEPPPHKKIRMLWTHTVIVQFLRVVLSPWHKMLTQMPMGQHGWLCLPIKDNELLLLLSIAFLKSKVKQIKKRATQPHHESAIYLALVLFCWDAHIFALLFVSSSRTWCPRCALAR